MKLHLDCWVPAWVAWPIDKCAYMGCGNERAFTADGLLRRWCGPHVKKRADELEAAGGGVVLPLVAQRQRPPT